MKERTFMYNDKILVCRDCKKEFTFTAGEQEFYEQKGFATEPTRCKECRTALKERLKPQRVMYEIVCSSCGKVAKIPFEPRHDRSVFCDECYKNQK